tara:strand:- start:91 stop:741 length:651 start_codon:yes stop_codon:yes gene_type:complete
MTNSVFFDAAHTELATAALKEQQISEFRAEKNVEPNKLFAISHLAVVAKSLGLDNPSFKGRKKVAGDFRALIQTADVKEAKAKLLAENAIKFSRHEEFANIVETANNDGSTGDFAQKAGAIFAALEITTQSKLVSLLNPKEDRTPAQVLAIAALKAAGAKAGDITVTNKRVSTGTVADDDAAQVLLDAVALILPGATEVAATLVDAINASETRKAA